MKRSDMMAVPPISEYLVPTLIAIAAAGGECSNDDIRLAVVQRLGLQASQVAARHGATGNRTEFEYRLAWARTSLRTKGLLAAAGSRRWKLTDDGWAEVRGRSLEGSARGT